MDATKPPPIAASTRNRTAIERRISNIPLITYLQSSFMFSPVSQDRRRYRLGRRRLGLFYYFKRQRAVTRVDVYDLPVADVAGQNQPCERGFHLALDRSLERPRSVSRVVTDFDEMFAGLFGQLEPNPALRQPCSQPMQ